MSNGKVIISYILFTIFLGLIPGLLFESWIWFGIGCLIAIIWWVIAGVAGDTILLKSINAEPLNVVIYNEIGKIVTSRRPGPQMGPPSLWMVSNLAPMIMSIGLNPRSSHLVFTKGFLSRLDDKAQLASIVRELESIRTGQTSANTAIGTLLWFILLPGRLVLWATAKQPDEPSALATFMNFIPAFVGAFFLMIAADKKAVYSIDRTAKKLLENPDYLPYALLKMQEGVLATPYNCDLALIQCCFIGPNNRDTFAMLYKPHPPTPKRIERLRPKNSSRG